MGKDSRYKWSIIIVFVVINWTPIQSFVAFDGANRIPFVLLLFTVLIYWSEIRDLCFKKPISFYLLLAPYMFINGLLHHSQLLYGKNEGMGIYLMAFSIFQPVLLMLLITCLSKYNFNSTLKSITFAVIVFCVLCLASGQMEDYGNEEMRLSSSINANEVALMIAMAFSFLLLLFIRKQIRIKYFVPIAVALVIAVLATGSRMGFGMIGIVAVVSIIMLSNQKSARSIIGSVLLLGAVFFLINYVLDNTVVGERLTGTSTQTEAMTIATGTILDKFGDRGLQYFYGWPFFIEHPVFGIGFHQWVNVGPLGFVCHSEYLVQSLEDGLVGLILYLLFFVGLIRQLWRKRTVSDEQYSRTVKVLFCAMLSLVFANSVLWTYTSTGVFALYGISYAMIIKST